MTMAVQKKDQQVEPLPRRNFLKRMLAMKSKPEDEAEENAEQSPKHDPSLVSNRARLRKNGYSERDALRQIAYGLYILTTGYEGSLNAITCNWVTQISFKPLLVLVAVEKESYSHRLLEESGVFALNLLANDQSHLARRMAIPHKHNPHKLAGIPYQLGATGAPLLDEALAWLECEVRHILEADGDHTLFVGEVVAGEVIRQAEPLTLLGSGLRYK
jgi:flavin reductase (DIM6/NTAB) family NADH-FMN oxidoreductase RutF